MRGAPETIGGRLSRYSGQLTELELASGLVLGVDPSAPDLPEADATVGPVEALARVMIPYLARPPCLVAFSGGRDSSIVLAVATAAARREGLELPIPITQRFPHAPGTEEAQWQELVVHKVGSTDWRKQIVDEDLDFIGPLACQTLLRHGVLWPSNAFGAIPLLREARGGTLLTGGDGDSLFRVWRWERAASVLARRVRPTPRDVLRVGLALAPPRLRLLRGNEFPDFRRLQSDALQIMRRAYAAEEMGEPFSWDKRVEWLARRRYLTVSKRSLDLLAKDVGAEIAHPFHDPSFLATLAHAGGTLGFGDLRNVMLTHFGSLLPAQLISRTDKAVFDEVFWGEHSRHFIKMWSANPVPIELVDRNGLIETWSEDFLPAPSATILQALWLATNGGRTLSSNAGDSNSDARTWG